MSENTAAKDPLIAALISKLPAPGATWPLSARINWLRMLVMAFNEAYGMEQPIVVSDVELPKIEPRRPALQLVPAERIDTVAAQEAHVAATAAAGTPRYVVDQEGFAMFGSKPVGPEDVPVDAVLWDERSGPDKGDLASVLWHREGTRPLEKLPKTLQLRAAA